jgi:hypothetical protein
MKQRFSRDHSLLAALAAAVLVLWAVGCNKEPPPSLFDPNIGNGPVPAISSVVPADSGLAGVTVLTINGSNFSPVKENNLVFFNAALGTVQQASATQLRVKAPLLIADSVGLKVAVQGIELFSNAIRYKLVAAVREFGVISGTVEEPFGITCDTAGNVYVSLLSSTGVGLGVKKFTPDGTRSDYSPPFSTSVNKWTSLKLGPGGYLYAAANRNAVFRIPPGGGSAAPWASVAGAGVSFLYDFDFDPQGNIWGGGDNASIVRVAPDRTVRGFPFAGNVYGVRYFQNYLYLATKNDTIWNVWRSRVFSADSIGPRELYFNFTAAFGSVAGAYALTFAADGDMFIGTDSLAGSVVVVHPDRSAEPFYPGLFKGKNQGLAYGKGVEMYLSQSGNSNAEKRILFVNTQKPGAPYYGRQ